MFKELDLNGLESWPQELADSTQSLLAEYPDVFSLEPSNLGCTRSTKHVIKVTDNTLFKEKFRFSPSLVEEVHTRLWEMLDSGAICPSKSAWCNVVVLVQKKDEGQEGWRSTLLYRFSLSQHPHKEKLLPTPEDPRSTGESFFMLRPKVWILANQDGQVIKTVHHIHCWQSRLLWVWLHVFWTVQCASYVPAANTKLPQGTEPNILPHLPSWHSGLLTDCWGIPLPLMCSLWPI